jgi:cullin 3
MEYLFHLKYCNTANNYANRSSALCPFPPIPFSSFLIPLPLFPCAAVFHLDQTLLKAQNSCSDYLKKAETRLAEEATRVVQYLLRPTEGKVRGIVEAELLSVHAKTLVEMENSGCVCMMRDGKLEDLSRMYNLFMRVPVTVDIIRDCMGAYVRQLGISLVTEQETVNDPVLFVQQMLDLKAKFDAIISDSFRNEKKSHKKLKTAFEEFVNRDSRCANHLASYVDDLLKNPKSGITTMTEDAADKMLTRVVVIFRYLTDKDIFENFYKTHLAKRLLSGKSLSEDMEKSMIGKLKAEQGNQFTSKLDGMFNDMSLSKELMADFKKSVHVASCPLEIEVQMLTSGFWPMPARPSIRLPQVVTVCSEVFSTFYAERSKGRKLQWLTHHGNADLKVSAHFSII